MGETLKGNPPDANETLLAMSLEDWARATVDQKKMSRHESKGLIHGVKTMTRPKPATHEQKLLMHPKLYPWLRDMIPPYNVSIGIQTVGDLVGVFKSAKTKKFNDEPWVWICGDSGDIERNQKQIDRFASLLEEQKLL